MNHSKPGLPVHHQLLEFTQTHVHRVSDAIQPSHPLLSPSPPAPNPSQHQSILYTVDPLNPFHLPLHLFPFGNRYSVLCISMCVFMWFGLFTYFVFFFLWLCFKLHIWVKWDSILCLFVWLVSLSIMPLSRSIPIVTYGKILVFLWLSIISLYIYTTASLSIHLLMGTHLFFLMFIYLCDCVILVVSHGIFAEACRVFRYSTRGLLCSHGTCALVHVGWVVVVHGLNCHMACVILVPWPGTEPASPALKGGSLTTGPPGRSLTCFFF